MKNIYEIMKEFGIEIPEDKKDGFDKAWKENYRTKAEFEKAAAKRDEYKQSLEDVQGKLEDFEKVDVEDLQNQVKTLTADLQKEKEERAAEESRRALEKTVDTFMGDKKFVNSLTADSIREKLMEELDKDTAKGKSIEAIFNGLITDKDGNQIPNIVVDEEQQKAEQNKAKFTTKFTGTGNGGMTKDNFRKLSLDERTKLKQSDPELYEAMRK